MSNGPKDAPRTTDARRCPSTVLGARCTGLVGHPGDHLDASAGKSWEERRPSETRYCAGCNQPVTTGLGDERDPKVWCVECADAQRPSEARYRCATCKTEWRLNPDGSWSASGSATPGECCDNVDELVSKLERVPRSAEAKPIEMRWQQRVLREQGMCAKLVVEDETYKACILPRPCVKHGEWANDAPRSETDRPQPASTPPCARCEELERVIRNLTSRHDAAYENLTPEMLARPEPHACALCGCEQVDWALNRIAQLVNERDAQRRESPTPANTCAYIDDWNVDDEGNNTTAIVCGQPAEWLHATGVLACSDHYHEHTFGDRTRFRHLDATDCASEAAFAAADASSDAAEQRAVDALHREAGGHSSSALPKKGGSQ